MQVAKKISRNLSNIYLFRNKQEWKALSTDTHRLYATIFKLYLQFQIQTNISKKCYKSQNLNADTEELEMILLNPFILQKDNTHTKRITQAQRGELSQKQLLDNIGLEYSFQDLKIRAILNMPLTTLRLINQATKEKKNKALQPHSMVKTSSNKQSVRNNSIVVIIIRITQKLLW